MTRKTISSSLANTNLTYAVFAKLILSERHIAQGKERERRKRKSYVPSLQLTKLRSLTRGTKRTIASEIKKPVTVEQTV